MKENILNPDLKPKCYYNGDRKEMLQFVPKDVLKIIEIGCGYGVFASSLKTERKAVVWGIELSKKAAEEASVKLDKVVIGDIENDNIALPKNYFDCIIFNDVLEHLKNPWVVLEKVKDYLIDGGYIVASVPNVRYFYNIKNLIKHKEWNYVDQGILDKTHLRFFTYKTIRDMFQICGYKIIKMEGINPIKFPWKFRLFNWLMLNAFEDMQFLQFACVSKKVDK